MTRLTILLAAALYLAACADHGDIADEHCEDEDKKAVWIGHDRDGNMHYKCM